ncbi:MAG: hypothetical protein Kow0059_00160 [Candidatus Sumerlaeia bacterium]
MFAVLLTVFVVLPLVELFILLQLADLIGGWATFALVIGTGLAGGVLVRFAGLSTLERIRRDVMAGRLPSDSILDGLIILVGAAFLLTPGVLTDAVGLSTLFPPVRAVYRALIKRWLKKKWLSGEVVLQVHSSARGASGRYAPSGPDPCDEQGESPDPGPVPSSGGTDAGFNPAAFDRFDNKTD